MAQPPPTSGGPPYIPTTASVGGRPNTHQDTPVCAVLIAVYLAAAIANMAIYQLNRRLHHKFLMSLAMFGFCMSRIVTCILRLVRAYRPKNARIAIASQIFTNAGVLIVYIVVLLLSLRIFRATQPNFGWNSRFRKTLKASYALLLGALLLTIAFTVVSLYTLNVTLKLTALWIQRGAILYMLLFNIASLALLLISMLLLRSEDNENFGTGSINSQLIILGVAVFFSIFIAGFRTGIIWAAPRPASNPAWYQTKPAFYAILFGFEIVIIYLFLFTRIDRRFWVPNGSNKPGDYSRIKLDRSTAPKADDENKAEQDKVE